MSSILETVVEPSKIYVEEQFLIKIRIDRIQSHNLITQTATMTVEEVQNSTVEEINELANIYLVDETTSYNSGQDITTEDGEIIITEGDYYEDE